MDKNTLQQVGEWAQSKVDSGEEPPWTHSKFKQLAQLMDDIIMGMNATVGIDAGMITTPDTCGHQLVSDSTDNIVSLEKFRPVVIEPEFPLPA